MSLLHDSNFLNFDGSSVMGRTPASVRVLGNDLSTHQRNLSAKAFAGFKNEVKLSITPFVQKRVTLEDGSVMQMTSNNGVDQVVIWPVGGSSSAFGRLFFGIPTSESYKLGYTPPEVAGPSAKWEDYPLTDPPESLTPYGQVSAEYPGNLREHPGNTTWSNPDITAENIPVVLSWRGADDRYSLTGIATAPGGKFDYFKDSSFIWVNGFRINTPCPRVTSAALFRPNAQNDPARVVLRVCTDSYPLGSVQLAVLDLELTGETPAARRMTLGHLFKNPSLSVTETYVGPISDGSSTSSYSGLLQRPHFNKSGTKLAAIVLASVATEYDGAAGWAMKPVGVTIDAETATIVKFFEPKGSSESTLTETETVHYGDFSLHYGIGYGGVSGVYGSGVFGTPQSWTRTAQRSNTSAGEALHAVDFVGDTPVALFTETTNGEQGSYEATWTEAAIWYMTSYSSTYSRPPRKLTVKHTLYGTLREVTYTQSEGATFSTFNIDGVLVGDLSKNAFGFAHLMSDLSMSQSVYGSEIMQTTTVHTPQLEFDFWGYNADTNALVLAEYSTATSPIDPVTSSTMTEFNQSSPPGGGTDQLSRITPVITTDAQSHSYAGPGGSVPGASGLYKHVAVDPELKKSYFGYRGEFQGIDVLMINDLKGGISLVDIPAYAPGLNPTLMAPVFLGATPK